MYDARCDHALYEWEQDGTRGIGTKKGDAFGETISFYIGLGGGERDGVDIHPC